MEGNSASGKSEVLMLFIAKTDNKQYEMEVRESATEWQVSLTDTKTEKNEIQRLSKKDYQQFGELISFIFKNRSYLIDIVTQGDEFTVFTKGSHKTIQLLTEERLLYNKLAGMGNDEKNINIQSGMPGKIVEIRVQTGTHVKEGDLLLVIEAMKMENEIRAISDGKIKKIYVKKGQNVETDARLLSIESNNTKDRY